MGAKQLHRVFGLDSFFLGLMMVILTENSQSINLLTLEISFFYFHKLRATFGGGFQGCLNQVFHVIYILSRLSLSGATLPRQGSATLTASSLPWRDSCPVISPKFLLFQNNDGRIVTLFDFDFSSNELKFINLCILVQ